MERQCLWILLILFIAGCSISDRTREYGSPTPKFRFEKNLDFFFDKRVPQVCLALSGGGIRSASTSIGFLGAIVSSNRFGSIDMVSSVSGGGWGLFWLYTGAFDIAFVDGAEVDNRLQKLVDNSVDIADRRFIDKSSALFSAFEQALVSPLFAPLQIFGLESTLSQQYEHAIFRKFHGERLYQLKVRNIAAIVERLGWPVPMFLMSSKKGAFPTKPRHQYHSGDIVEVSPYWIGNAKLGYLLPIHGSDGSRDSDTIRKQGSKLMDMELSRAVALSAAAIDSPIVSPSQPTIPYFARNLGFVLGGSYRIGENRDAYFLSDAGFVENLGVTPLLMYGCQRIVVIDASHDPFLDLASLNQMICNAKQKGWSPGTTVWRGGKYAISIDGYSLPSHRFDVDLRRDDGRTATLSVLKLGISHELAETEKYPEEVVRYKQKNWLEVGTSEAPCIGEGLEYRCRFPHQATVQQEFSDDEFLAYRALGAYLAKFIDWEEFEPAN